MSDFKGIVLTNVILNDNDIIMNVLSEVGKVSIKAKGVLKPKSKNRVVTQVGCFCLFHTIDRVNQQVYLLKNAETIERFNSIQSNLDKQAIMQCLLEGFNKLEISFNDAVQYIRYLNDSINPYCLYALYLCHLIRDSGIMMVVDECVKCHTLHGLYAFSTYDGGFICKDCYDSQKHIHLTIQELKNFRYGMHAHLNDFFILEDNTSFTYNSCEQLYHFFEYYSGIKIKSHAFLKIIQPLD
ncbi:MAG: DNA repair protein RecO [Traorella sp.]